MKYAIVFLFVSLLLVGCTQTTQETTLEQDAATEPSEQMGEFFNATTNQNTGDDMKQTIKRATFAGGCFWCMEPPFENAPGVIEVHSGYAGGEEKNPTYKEVSAGETGHIESIEITYDEDKISYAQLLDIFWKNIDPTDPTGQFVDKGSQYASAVFYHDATQKKVAEESKKALEASKRFDKPIVTKLLPYTQFYLAEDYHQDYYVKSPVRYSTYRYLSGRDQFLKDAWGDEPHGKEAYHGLQDTRKVTTNEGVSSQATFVKPSDEELQQMLTPLQYKVTQKDGTEPSFSDPNHDSKAEGIYVDVVSGEPLFSSTHKYDSKTGWPSFWQPIDADAIKTKTDYKLILPRTEVRSKLADSHLGHVFKDGPAPTGLRYCMNGAAIRFVPKDQLEKEGYGKYLGLFT